MHFNDAMQHVLRQSKYDTLTGRSFDLEDFVQSLIERLARLVLEFIFSVFNIAPPAGRAYNTAIYSAVFFALALLVFVAIVFVLYFIFRRKKTQQSLGMETIFSALQNKTLSYEDLLAESDLYAADGHYRDAVRYRYISLLWLFNVKKMLNVDKAKTNSQIKREIYQKAKPLSNSFFDIVDVFQRAWFGHKLLSAESYASFCTTLDELAKEVTRYEKTP